MTKRLQRSIRRGGVYLAVLGTAMIVSVLALSALALQRVQNRMLTSSADVRQAQHNAEAAIELGLLTIKTDPSWRNTYPHGNWFLNRNLDVGTCSLSVIDTDGNLADEASDSIVLTGTGNADSAEQRIVRTIDVYAEPLGCLSSSVAAGEALSLSGGATLRATNSGLVTANSSSVSSSTVHGRVKAVTVSGGNYTGTATQIAAADRPGMPNWSTVFDYYRNNATEISVSNLPSTAPNLVKNGTMVSGLEGWAGNPPDVAPTAELTAMSGSYYSSGTGNTAGLRVRNRGNNTGDSGDDYYAGAAQSIDSFVKPGQDYVVEAYVHFTGIAIPARKFGITCYTKGTGDASPLIDGGLNWPNQSAAVLPQLTWLLPWQKISATITARPWTGDLEYAFIKIAGADGNNTGDFYLDEVTIRETTTGRFIYRRAIGPGANPFGIANGNGLYWINCANNRIIIERSRIRGTLLLVNPGSGSMVGTGVHWAPLKPGYPALLVDADTSTNADFTIAGSNRALSEAEDSFNYNPTGVSHETLSTDTDMNDTYPSEIQGLIVVEDDVTFQNNALVRGSVIAGGDVTAANGSLEVIYRPDALYSPPPGLTGSWGEESRPLSVRKVVQ